MSSYIYSHSYEDPETGRIVDVLAPDDDEDEPIRNATVDHRTGRRRTTTHVPRSKTGGMSQRRTAPVRYPSNVPSRSRYSRAPAAPVETSGEYLAIRKSAVAQMIPALGQVWAAFLGQPDMPRSVGDDIVDRDNAALHRDALARHEQNQRRIVALTDLAGRALGLFMD